jgi:hypothetical protein
MDIDNLDENGRYWYRRLGRHPRSDFEAIALRFRTRIAELLEIPPPSLHWYEAANKLHASEEFDRCVETSGDEYRFDIYNDSPLDLPCEYYRWPQDEPERVSHG